MPSNIDIVISAPVRKTRKDILTVGMAIDSNKSSKDHKLKPRSVKRDRTKQADAKHKTKARRMSLIMKTCAM